MTVLFFWAQLSLRRNTIKRRRRRGQPHFHLLLWLWGGCGAASLLAGVYLALKLLEAHVWENYPLLIEDVSLRLWLFCAASGLAASFLSNYIFSTNPDSFYSPFRIWQRRFIPTKVTSYLYAILYLACLLSGFYAIGRAVGIFSLTFWLSWIGIELVRRAIREHQAALSISIDSFGLIPEEVQLIENQIFAHQRHEAARFFEFYTSAREAKEVTKLNDKSAKASPEAKAFIEKLARELQRKYPEKFSPIPTKEELRKRLAETEERIAALEANQLDKFPAIKSEEQRQSELRCCKLVQQVLRTQLADMSSEDS